MCGPKKVSNYTSNIHKSSVKYFVKLSIGCGRCCVTALEKLKLFFDSLKYSLWRQINCFPVPGINYYIAMNNTPSVTSSTQSKGISWAQGLSSEDINAMHRKFLLSFSVNWFLHLNWIIPYTELGALSSTGLIAEIRKLYDQAYDLGIQEAKEMTRGRYLNIFPITKKK